MTEQELKKWQELVASCAGEKDELLNYLLDEVKRNEQESADVSVKINNAQLYINELSGQMKKFHSDYAKLMTDVETRMAKLKAPKPEEKPKLELVSGENLPGLPQPEIIPATKAQE